VTHLRIVTALVTHLRIVTAFVSHLRIVSALVTHLRKVTAPGDPPENIHSSAGLTENIQSSLDLPKNIHGSADPLDPASCQSVQVGLTHTHCVCTQSQGLQRVYRHRQHAATVHTSIKKGVIQTFSFDAVPSLSIRQGHAKIFIVVPARPSYQVCSVSRYLYKFRIHAHNFL
jgi:hypothetical protein